MSEPVGITHVAARDRPRVHPFVDRLGAYSWRLIGIGVVALAVLWLLGRMRTAVAPIVVAVLLTRALAPISNWLRRHRWRPSLAAVGAILAFFLLLAGLSRGDRAGGGRRDRVARSDAHRRRSTTSRTGWSTTARSRCREPRSTSSGSRAGERVDALFSGAGSDGAVLDGATLVAEIVAGLILALLLTFFMLRDGDRFTDMGDRARATGAPTAAAPGR